MKKADEQEAKIGSAACQIIATCVSMALGNNFLKQVIIRSELRKWAKKTLLAIIYSCSA